MSDMIYCRGCGKQIHKTAPTCPSCGAVQASELHDGGDLKTQTAAGLWCVFLGQFGAHWFYLGRTVAGVLSLLFFWTAIPGIIAFVNGLQIAYGDRYVWAKKYNNGVPTPPVHWMVKILVIALPVLGIFFWVALLNT